MASDYRKFSFIDRSFIITMRKSVYGRTETGKAWKTRPEEQETTEITPEYYTNYIRSIPFFNNFGFGSSCKCYKGNCIAGYNLPYKVVTISPYMETKIVAEFYFTCKH